MRNLPPLTALRAFEAAARHGSFKRAAAELAVTPTAISHQVHALEEHTGLALFDRRTRKVVLTDAGTQLYPVLRDGLDAFAHVLERLTSRRARAQVTLSATTAFTARWLLPRMAKLRKELPDLDLRFHASDEAVDFASAGVDLAIRYGRGPYPGYVAETLFADTFAPVASPRLKLKSPAGLARVPRIEFDWRRPHAKNPTWKRWQLAGARLPAGPELRFSEESHAIQAAVAGEGVALISLALVTEELAAGHLVRPFGPSLPGLTYHLLRKTTDDARVEAVAAWLRSEASTMERQ